MKNFLKEIVHFFGLEIKKYRNEKPLLFFLSSFDVKTVIDAGANVGQFSSQVREVLPNVPIYAYEPVSETFKQLQKNFTDDKNYHCFNTALGSNNSEAEINKNEYSPSSSLLENTQKNNTLFPHTKNVSKETIRVTRLDDAKIPIEKNILIKLDVQGFEMEVFKGGIKMLQQAKIIIIEVSFVELYKEQPLFDEIYDFLKKHNFKYHGSLQNKYDPKTNEILFEDAVFIKK